MSGEKRDLGDGMEEKGRKAVAAPTNGPTLLRFRWADAGGWAGCPHPNPVQGGRLTQEEAHQVSACTLSQPHILYQRPSTFVTSPIGESLEASVQISGETGFSGRSIFALLVMMVGLDLAEP